MEMMTGGVLTCVATIGIKIGISPASVMDFSLHVTKRKSLVT